MGQVRLNWLPYQQRVASPTNDLGADYYTRIRPDRAKNRAIAQLEAMGYKVTLQPTA